MTKPITQEAVCRSNIPLRLSALTALIAGGVLAAGSAFVASNAHAASHREAPFITSAPKVDGTDFYMFRSYEPGREAYVTLIADYVPFQTPYGGPNFFQLDENALYEIHVDNNGDAKEDISFQFRFKNNSRNLTVPVGGKQYCRAVDQYRCHHWRCGRCQCFECRKKLTP